MVRMVTLGWWGCVQEAEGAAESLSRGGGSEAVPGCVQSEEDPAIGHRRKLCKEVSGRRAPGAMVSAGGL